MIIHKKLHFLFFPAARLGHTVREFQINTSRKSYSELTPSDEGKMDTGGLDLEPSIIQQSPLAMCNRVSFLTTFDRPRPQYDVNKFHFEISHAFVNRKSRVPHCINPREGGIGFSLCHQHEKFKGGLQLGTTIHLMDKMFTIKL